MFHSPYRGLALVLALAGTQAHALGVGGLQLQSALDQPFVGEIDLVDVKPDELDAVKVQIAPQADFSRAGTERYHYLTKLRFSAQISPRGKPVIRVSSREPMREPYMDFLVEVVWPKGRMVKQYTVLLDPAVTTARSAPRIAPPVVEARPPAPAPAAAPVPAAPIPTRPPARPAETASPSRLPPAAPALEPARSPPAAATGEGGKRVGPIRSGTGLWRLARGVTPPGATVSQTAMALYRTNQDAFVNGDVNQLIVGKTLTMPPPGEVFAQSAEAAKLEFEAALKGEKVRRSPLADPNAPGASAAQGESRLRIAGVVGDVAKNGAAAPGRGGADGEGMEKELLLVRETSESARQETVELRSRIHDLESQLSDIQQLLTLRNEELARVQGGAVPGVKVADRSTGPDARPTASGTAPTTGVPSPRPVPEAIPGDLTKTMAAVGGLPPGDDAGGSRGQSAAPATGSAAGAAASAGGTQAVAVVPSAAPASAAGATAQPRPDAKPGATPAAVAIPMTAPQVPAGTKATVAAAPAPSDGSTWRVLLLSLAGVAGVTAMGVGALTWLRARRRVAGPELDAPAPLGTGVGAATAVSGARLAAGGAGEAVDADAADEGSKSGRSEPETDEADALSEADIYIAYGRYREAEDLLREEIRRTPDRLDLKFKLAEAYSGAKNTAALRGLMQEVQAAGGDQANPVQWRRLCDMAAVTPAAAAAGLPAAPPSLVKGHVGGGSGAVPDSGGRPASSAAADAADILDISTELTLDDGFDLQASDQSSDKAGDLEASAGVAERKPSLGEEWSPADDLDLYAGDDAVQTPPPMTDVARIEDAAPQPGGLTGPGSPPAPAPAGRAPAVSDAGDPLAPHWQLDSDLWDETATKLDLARAYIEMGDTESAKGMLEEVVAEGSDEKRAQARGLLQRLGIPLDVPVAAAAPPRSPEPVSLDALSLPTPLNPDKGFGVQGLDQALETVGGAGAAAVAPDLDLDLTLDLDEARPADILDLYRGGDPLRMSQPIAAAGGTEDLAAAPSWKPATQTKAPATGPGPTGPFAPVETPAASAASDLPATPWQADSGLWDETATKLDLARAYIEMGDQESARGILEEVIGHGSDEKRAEARELLRRAS